MKREGPPEDVPTECRMKLLLHPTHGGEAEERNIMRTSHVLGAPGEPHALKNTSI